MSSLAHREDRQPLAHTLRLRASAVHSSNAQELWPHSLSSQYELMSTAGQGRALAMLMPYFPPLFHPTITSRNSSREVAPYLHLLIVVARITGNSLRVKPGTADILEVSSMQPSNAQ